VSVADAADLVRTWERLSKLPFGRRLFSRLLGHLVPYGATISPEVRALAPGYAQVRIRVTKKLMNHIQSAHAMALGNLAELTGGLALTFGMPGDRRLVAAKFTLEYRKRGYGVLTAECRAPAVDWGPPKQVIDVEVFIRDAAGDVVVRGVGTYHLSVVGRR
jgi:acyl-coenzyme A thioesterase PaaI-like protein